MPAVLSYPGVYIEEVPSGVRTIVGVATSITAFIGRSVRGPVGEPVRVQSFAEFERVFGGLWIDSTLGYAVAHFFLNGGGDALVVRVTSGAEAVAAKADVGGLPLVAAEAGGGGNDLKASIGDASGGDPAKFKLTITDAGVEPPTEVVVDDIEFANVETALAGKPVQLAPGTPAPGARPANTAAAVPFKGGVDAPGKAGLELDGFKFVAASEGSWGNKLRLRVEHPPVPAGEEEDTRRFNLAVRDKGTDVNERFLNLSTDPKSPRYVVTVLAQQSKLVTIDGATVPGARPTQHDPMKLGEDGLLKDGTSTAFTGTGADGPAITDDDISKDALQAPKKGIWALEKADLFNLLCIPPLTEETDIGVNTRTQAAKYCEERRALFIVDPPASWTDPGDPIDAAAGVDSAAFGLARTNNAAIYFPRVKAPDPLREGQIGEFAPCGAVAGVMARTDATRGVWKAPAGIEATLNGVVELTVKLTDGENGQLNPLGVNCLRSFPVIGRVVWGSRTLRGADQLASEWKYVPVRRLALFLEESLYRGTQWVVFEPNDEPLWSQIRLNAGAFMQNLFRQGAFQGRTPREAYFVKCDKDTTTQNDIDRGVVNIAVGFAPLKPAEFVVIKLQQMAGQVET